MVQMYKTTIALMTLSILWPCAPRAETVVCADTIAEASVWAGPALREKVKGVELEIAQGLPPDIGGDYDEAAPQMEWNDLNRDATRQAEAVCGADDGTSPRITIPRSMSRCLFIKEAGRFVCRSGTVACPGYVQEAVIRTRGNDGTYTNRAVSRAGSRRLVWADLQKEKNGMSVICSGENGAAETVLALPAGMKSCALERNRFRCTDSPDVYDAFWPKPHDE